MIAAIYARKSTEQAGRADENKSVTRQVENARAYATERGWTVAEGHVYADDGISGTEFEKRPAFMRMMASLKPRAPFQVLIVSEQKSLGREMFKTGAVIMQLAEAGVEIVEYVHGRSLSPKTTIEKLLSQVQGFSDEDHAVKTSERVIEAHTKSFGMGRVVGGRVFGYRNAPVYNGVDASGNPIRSHFVREVKDAEAEVVRRIYTLYDEGHGLKRIAMLLNDEGAVTPTAFNRKDPTKVKPEEKWAPGTIRAILRREIYNGELVWNKSKKRDESLKVNQKPRPESEWLRAEAEHLRIVDEQLWRRVQKRRRENETLAARVEGGRLSGRPPKTATQNLLAGLATCALCGGSLVVETSSRKRGRVPEYVCYRRRANGTCENKLRFPVADLNEAVLQAIEEHALTPEAIEQVIRLSERDDVAERQLTLEREHKDNAKRIGRLVAAIESGGGSVGALVEKLSALEARQQKIVGEAAGLRPVPRLPAAVVENRLAEWRRLLRSSVTQGRTVLQRILRGRLEFTPAADWNGEVNGYDFRGPTRFDRLFTGVAYERPTVDDDGTLGSEAIGAEDTWDGDYSRLLERAYENRVEVLASPTGFANSWRVRIARKAA